VQVISNLCIYESINQSNLRLFRPPLTQTQRGLQVHKKSVNKISKCSQSLKQPIGKLCTDYYAQSGGGAEGLVKYPRDKVGMDSYTDFKKC